MLTAGTIASTIPHARKARSARHSAGLTPAADFFVLVDVVAGARRGRKAAAGSTIALGAVRRIDELFAIERGITGRPPDERLRVRRAESAPLMADLETWLCEQRSRLSRSAAVTEPIDYLLRRWPSFTHFLKDGRICVTNNAAERALSEVLIGPPPWQR